MPTIANAAILFTINAAGIKAGLTGVRGAVDSLGTSLKGMGAIASEAFAILAPVLAISKLANLSIAAVDSIKRLDQLSIQTGVSAESLSRLGYAAQFSGLDMEHVAESINRMQRTLNESIGKDGNIFASIGLSAKKLANEKPDQALGQIADAISKLPTATDRAGAALEIFGKSGADLLPFLSQGSEGIKKLGLDADKLGITITGLDASKVAAMHDAVEKLGQAFTGAINTIVIQAAPLITALLDKITDFLTSGPGLVGAMTYAFETLLGSIAEAADYTQLFNAAFLETKALAVVAVADLIDIFIRYQNTINNMLDNPFLKAVLFSQGIPTIKIDTSGMVAASDSLKEQAGEIAIAADKAYQAFSGGENAAKVATFFQDLRNKANQLAAAEVNAHAAGKGMTLGLDDLAEKANKIHDIMLKLKTDVSDFGLTDSEKAIAQLKELGASADQLAKAQSLLNKMEQLEAFKGLQDEAKKVIDELETPDDKIAKLNTLAEMGLITWQQYDLAVKKVNESLDKSHEAPKAPELFEAGSQKARRLSLDLATGFGTASQLGEAKKTNGWLEKMYNKLPSISEPIKAAGLN